MVFKRINGYFGLILIISNVLLAVSSYYLSYANGTQYNADFLQVEDMYRDIWLNSGEFAKWVLPGSLYIYDFLLYSLVRFFSPNLHVGLAAFSAVQSVLLSLVSGYSLHLIFPKRYDVALAVLPSLLVAVVTLFPWPASIILINYCHVLGLISSILCMSIYVVALDTQSLKSYITLFTITVLAIFPEPLVILWFALPAIGLTFLLWFFKDINSKVACRISGALVAGVLLGKIFDILLRFGNSPVGIMSPRLKRLFENTPLFLSKFLSIVTSTPLFGTFWTLGILGLLVGSITSSRSQKYSWLILISLICSVIGVTINGHSEPRYFLLFYLLPIVTGVPYLLLSQKRFQKAGVVFLCASAMAFTALIFLAWNAYSNHKFYKKSPVVACVDQLAKKYHVQFGFGGYWDARKISILSEESVCLAPAYGFGMYPEPRNRTSRKFRDSYEFVLMDNGHGHDDTKLRDMALLKEINGAPADEVVCGNKTFLYYPEGARMANKAELLWNGEKLVPEFAQNDVHKHVNAALTDGIVVDSINMGRRWAHSWLYFVVSGPLENFLGKTCHIRMVGKGTPSHKRKISRWVSHPADSLLDNLFVLFMDQKKITLSEKSCLKLDADHWLIFTKSPNRNVKSFETMLLEIDGQRFRIL